MLAAHKATSFRRPPSKPRFGAIIERSFGVITSTLLNSLLGNTQRLKLARQLAAKDHPKLHAIWTLPMLECALSRFFDLRAERKLPHLGKTAAVCLTEYLAKNPRAILNHVDDDEAFYLSTLLETAKKTCKVQRGYGIKFKSEYYSNIALEGMAGEDVRVLWDPGDITGVYVLVDNKWVRAESKYADRLKGFSRRELEYYSKTYRQRYLLCQKENYEHGAANAIFIDSLKGEEHVEFRRKQELAAKQSISPQMVSDVSLKSFTSAEAKLLDTIKRKPGDIDRTADSFYDILNGRPTTEILVTKKVLFSK